MKSNILKSDSLLLSAAIIWGFAFVAQRKGMDYIGPFLFNGIRFALGCLSLLLLLIGNNKNDQTLNSNSIKKSTKFLGSLLAGVVIFVGSSLQQIGIVYTSAGNAGFITGLYIIIVPMISVIWKQKIKTEIWIGVVLATVGLYFLSVTEQLEIAKGDLYVFINSIFWAAHVHIIGWLSPKIQSVKLAFIQYISCSLLSLFVAIIFEPIVLDNVLKATVPILYGGIFSVGIAYTLQIKAQKSAHPAHAAIILSLEAVFAVLGGWLILDESLTFRGISGCTLMLLGMLVSQLNYIIKFSKN